MLTEKKTIITILAEIIHKYIAYLENSRFLRGEERQVMERKDAMHQIAPQPLIVVAYRV